MKIDFEKAPPYFAVKTDQSSDSILKDLLDDPSISKIHKQIIRAILDIGSHDVAAGIEDLNTYLNISPERKKPLSVLTNRNYVADMHKRGLLLGESVKHPDKLKQRPRKLYILDLTKPHKEQLTEKIDQADCIPKLHPSQMDLFEDVYPTRPRNNKLWMDDFWCQFISAVLPISSKDKIHRIEGHVMYRGREIPITVTTRHGNKIPTIRSIQVVIALLSIVENAITRNPPAPEGPVETRFVVDLRDILNLLKRSNNGTNRKLVLRKLREWEDAIFSFGSIPVEAQKELERQFEGQVMGFQNHQLISQLCGVGEIKDRQVTPSQIGLELPTDLVRRIANKGVYNLFRVTPGIMNESNPLAIAFHLYCRKTIGHRTQVLEITLKGLWKRIAGAMDYEQFKREFTKIIVERNQFDDREFMQSLEYMGEDFKSSELYQAKILGYTVSMHARSSRLDICRDPDDPYVGYRSAHARLKK